MMNADGTPSSVKAGLMQARLVDGPSCHWYALKVCQNTFRIQINRNTWPQWQCLFFTHLMAFVYILCIHSFVTWKGQSTLQNFGTPVALLLILYLSLILETSTGTWNVEVWQIYLQPLVWIVSMKIWSLVSLWVWQYGGQRGACVMWNETCNMTRSFMNPGLRSNIHLLVICSQSQVLYRLKKSWICYHSSKGVYR
jgi:hypothetical protein